MSWPPIPIDVAMSDLVGKNLAVSGTSITGQHTLVLLSARPASRGRVKFWCMDTALRTTAPPRPAGGTVPGQATLAEIMLAYGPMQASRAGEVPKIKWSSNSLPINHWLVWTLMTGGLLASFLLRSPSLFLYLLVPLVSLVLVSKFPSIHAIAPPSVIDEGRELFASAVLARLPTALPKGLTPVQRVEQVKASYAQLQGDIVYRIECSALFDPKVKTTQRFRIALMAWDPAALHAAALASEVEDSFRAAREHAEELGVDHLPETARAGARRAVKAATLALHSPNEAERAAASAQVADLLGSLALYWMPTIDPATPGLVGQRKMIEPTP